MFRLDLPLGMGVGDRIGVARTAVLVGRSNLGSVIIFV